MSLNKRLFIPQGTVVEPTENFNTVTYDGQSTDKSVTEVGFQPDLVWIKCRDVQNSHVIADSVRGSDGTRMYFLMSNSTNQQSTSNQIETLDSLGFTVFGDRSATNRNNQEYVAWCFKAGGSSNTFNIDGTGYSTASAASLDDADGVLTAASVNTAAGFGIYKVEYGANEYTTGFKHGLTSAPELVITKRTDSSSTWYVINDNNGSNDRLQLNTVDGFSTDQYFDMDSTTISTGYSTSAYDMVAYAFHSVDGYQKVGEYTGNSYSDVTVTTGFRPRFVMIKTKYYEGGWTMYDDERQDFDLFQSRALQANTNSTEWPSSFDAYYGIKATSTGFIVQHYDGGNDTTSKDNKKYLYLAIA